MRRALWILGAPARVLVLGLLRAYQALIAPALGERCRFYPSCSAYAVQAVRRHGAVKGSALALWRVLRCSPLSSGGPDPVPTRHRSRRGAMYDGVIQEP
jgi:putative membrane protein insertion efficiency factor